MKIVRPINLEDQAALSKIAEDTGPGFTSLPTDPDTLKQKVMRSVASFANQPIPDNDTPLYMFVLEDFATGEVCGVSAIETCVGETTPMYHFFKQQHTFGSELLGVENLLESLSLTRNYQGVSEVCSLFLSPHHRGPNIGKLLSKTRFLFMADHLESFQPTVIAEMRGFEADDGVSPFWDWIQSHFLPVDFKLVDFLMGVGQRKFVPEMLPAHPLYTRFMSDDARESIGKVHKNTSPALAMLEKEGFSNKGFFDLFDAGPTVENEIENITSIKDSDCFQIAVLAESTDTYFLVSNRQRTNFRSICVCARLDPNGRTLYLDSDSIQALQVNPGDEVRALAL